MSLPKCNVNVNVIENLPDTPNLPANELKQKFDEAGKGIKDYLNTILTKEVESLVAKEKSNLQKIIETQETTLLKHISNKILEDNQKKYYVGKIIMDTQNINPKTYLGFGTWEKWGEGKVPVGVDLEIEEFNEVEKIGGEIKHQLTAEEMPSHRHDVYFSNTGMTGGSDSLLANPSTGELSSSSMTLAGGNKPHNNLQPYITCYMWKRVA